MMRGTVESAHINHIEFYVTDAREAADYYRAAFGFQLAAEGGPETGSLHRRSVLLQHGKIQLLFSSALIPHDPLMDYVARHGDGVKDIALRVPDLTEAFRRAVGAGSTPVAEPFIVDTPEGHGATAT